MPQYLIQVGYTPGGWNALVQDPQNRIEKVRPAIEAMGGTLIGGWLAFGEYDVVVIADMPDNITAAAFSIAVSAGGAVDSIQTTPLMTAEESVEALKKASTSIYEPATT